MSVAREHWKQGRNKPSIGYQDMRPPTHTHTSGNVKLPVHLLACFRRSEETHMIARRTCEPIPSQLHRHHNITFRNFKNISHQCCWTCSSSFQLVKTVALFPKALIKHHGNILSTNQLTSLKCITFTHPDPWFTPSVHHVKHTGHQLQCLRKKTGMTVHKLASKYHSLLYKVALKKAKCEYYTPANGNDQGDPGAFSTTKYCNSFICQNSAEHFGRFLMEKKDLKMQFQQSSIPANEPLHLHWLLIGNSLLLYLYHLLPGYHAYSFSQNMFSFTMPTHNL